MASSPPPSSDDLIAPYEIVFSCSLCQKIISDIYTRLRSDKGLIHGSDGAETFATKLWMTGCAHIICGEHFEGGGVPFHPVDERPKAACPVCVKERGDPTKKTLFGVVSSQPGEHDVAIPHEYFETPPDGTLTESSQGTKAIRFQYLSVVRYGRAMRQRLEEAKQLLAAGEKRRGQHLASIQALREERAALQSSVERLEAVEKKYKAYKDREPEIKRYLEQFSDVARMNAVLKDQLAGLRYAVTQTERSMESTSPNAGAVALSQFRGVPRSDEQPLRAVDAPSRNQYRQSDIQHLSCVSSRKRTREDYLEGLTNGDLEVVMEAPVQQRSDIIESILPPPLPTQSAARRLLPTVRDQFESSPSQRYLGSRGSAKIRPRANVPVVQTCRNGAWNDARQEDVQTSRPYQQSGLSRMNGSIGPSSGRRDTQMGRQNVEAVSQPRFTRPPPESITEQLEEVYFRQSEMQPHSDLLQWQYNHIESIQNAQTPTARLLPSRPASRSSFVRRPLVQAPSRGNIGVPDSGYYSNGEPQYASGHGHMDKTYGRTPSLQAGRAPQPMFDSPFFKPHFHGPVPQHEFPMHRRGVASQSEQLTNGLRHLRMEPASQQPQPRMRPSLNALSFIDEPYNATNQPIFAQQRCPPSQSQEEQQYRPAAISRAGFVQDPRVPKQVRRPPNSIRLPSALPSSSQPLAHTCKGSRNGGSMVRSIGKQGMRPSTNSYSPGGGYFPRANAENFSSCGIFSAAGRRSVRR